LVYLKNCRNFKSKQNPIKEKSKFDGLKVEKKTKINEKIRIFLKIGLKVIVHEFCGLTQSAWFSL